MNDAGPFAYQVDKRLTLLLRQLGAFDPLRLNHLPVTTRPEGQIAHFESECGLFALCFVERTIEGKGLISFAPQGANCFSFEFESRWLGTRMAGRKRAV